MAPGTMARIKTNGFQLRICPSGQAACRVKRNDVVTVLTLRHVPRRRLGGDAFVLCDGGVGWCWLNLLEPL